MSALRDGSPPASPPTATLERTFRAPVERVWAM